MRTGLIIAGILIALVLLYRPLADLTALVTNQEQLEDLLQRAGLWGPVILIVLFLLQTFVALIPGQVLMVASAYLYGFWGGLLITWFSLTLGGQIAFWLARRYGRPLVVRFVKPEVVERWSSVINRQGIAFYVITLVMPFFPNDAMCYLAGLEIIRPRRFLAANMLGRLVASSITSFVGAFGAGFPWWGWVLVLVAILLATVIGHVYRSRVMADSAPVPAPRARRRSRRKVIEP